MSKGDTCEDDSPSRDEIDEVEDSLKDVEAALEKVGQRVCPRPNSAHTWGYINRAIVEVQKAIHSAYQMREEP